MKLTEDVYLVGGGDTGFNISNRMDCHVFVIRGEDELALVDAGFDGPGKILSNIENDGLDPGTIRRIFVTHYHADHVGALAQLKRELGAAVIAGKEAAPTIRDGDAEQTGLAWAQEFGFYPPDFRWEACEVEEVMADGDRFEVGGLELTSIATPGHCSGHYSLLLKGRERTYLLAGDQVFWGGAVVLQNVRDSSIQDCAASMQKLLNYDFDALLPSHLAFSLERGKRHVEAGAKAFEQTGLPRNLFG